MTGYGRFLFLFLGVQLCLIFFHIHKNSTLVKYSYAQQRSEKQKSELLEQKNALAHKLQSLKRRTTISEDAQRNGMVPVRLDRIKRIDELHDEPIQIKT